MEAGVSAQRGPLIVACAMRSGATLLRLMLDHHPRIAMVAGLSEAMWRLPDRGWPKTEELREHLRRDRAFADAGYRLDESLDASEIIRDVLDRAGRRSGKPVVGTCVFMKFDRILDVWPDARLIHLVRDPRAVARSGLEPGFVGTPWHGCDQWLASEASFDRIRPLIPADRRIDLSFESLLREPAAQLDRCCRLVGERFHERMLSYPDDTTYGPPDLERIDGWKDELSARDLALIQGRCAELMLARGYEIADPPGEVHPGPLARAALTGENRVRRFMWSVRRYGWTLAGLRAVRRVIPMPARIDMAILERQHHVDRSHLR